MVWPPKLMARSLVAEVVAITTCDERIAIEALVRCNCDKNEAVIMIVDPERVTELAHDVDADATLGAFFPPRYHSLNYLDRRRFRGYRMRDESMHFDAIFEIMRRETPVSGAASSSRGAAADLAPPPLAPTLSRETSLGETQRLRRAGQWRAFEAPLAKTNFFMQLAHFIEVDPALKHSVLVLIQVLYPCQYRKRFEQLTNVACSVTARSSLPG